MYFLSNARNPKYFDLYKTNMDDLSSIMIMENNEGYSYYPLSNNDKYLVMVKRPSRDVDLMYLLDLESNKTIMISDQESNFWGQGFDKNDENYYYMFFQYL